MKAVSLALLILIMTAAPIIAQTVQDDVVIWPPVPSAEYDMTPATEFIHTHTWSLNMYSMDNSDPCVYIARLRYSEMTGIRIDNSSDPNDSYDVRMGWIVFVEIERAPPHAWNITDREQEYITIMSNGTESSIVWAPPPDNASRIAMWIDEAIEIGNIEPRTMAACLPPPNSTEPPNVQESSSNASNVSAVGNTTPSAITNGTDAPENTTADPGDGKGAVVVDNATSPGADVPMNSPESVPSAVVSNKTTLNESGRAALDDFVAGHPMNGTPPIPSDNLTIQPMSINETANASSSPAPIPGFGLVMVSAALVSVALTRRRKVH